MATSTIVVPDIQAIENFTPACATALVAVATAALADITGLTAASLASSTPASEGAAATAGVAATASKSDHVHPWALKKTVIIDATVVGDADTNGTAATVNVGTALPAGAIVLAAQVTATTLFSGGSLASATLDVGFAGNTTKLISAMDVFTGAATGIRFGDQGANPTGPYSAKQIIATLTPDGGEKISAATAGSVTIDIFYAIAF